MNCLTAIREIIVYILMHFTTTPKSLKSLRKIEINF